MRSEAIAVSTIIKANSMRTFIKYTGSQHINTAAERTSIAASIIMTASYRMLRSGESTACFFRFLLMAGVFVM